MTNLTEQEYIDKIKSGQIDFQDIPEHLRTDKICLAGFKANTYNFIFIDNQTREMCMHAVTIDGMLLDYVKNQTDEICLAAIKNNGFSLSYVKNQTEELYKESFKTTDFRSIAFVDANIYVYDKSDLIKACISWDRDEFYKYLFLDKLAEILNKLDDENLVIAVNEDLKEFFDKQVLNEQLQSIKSKVDMLLSLNLNNGNLNIKNKSKLI